MVADYRQIETKEKNCNFLAPCTKFSLTAELTENIYQRQFKNRQTNDKET